MHFPKERNDYALLLSLSFYVPSIRVFSLFLKIYLFYLFIFGCTGSLLLRAGFL